MITADLIIEYVEAAIKLHEARERHQNNCGPGLLNNLREAGLKLELAEHHLRAAE